MIKKLAFYDFDHTIYPSPEPEEGKKIWKEKTGEDWPNKGWWYQPDSLNTDVFDLKPYSSIVSKIENDNVDPETYTVLLTGRMVNMGSQIKNILDSDNINFDDYNFAKKPEEPKTDRIIKYLEKFPDVYDVTVYDDRNKEITAFKQLKDKLRIFDINFEINQVNDGTLTLIESMIREEIEKNVINEGVDLKKISNFVATLKNKGNVATGILNKLRDITNPVIKKYFITALLLLTFGNKLGKADMLMNGLSTKLSHEKIATLSDFVNKTKSLVKQDETLINAIQPILPDDIQGQAPLTKNDAIKMGLIDGVFEVDKELITQLAGINKGRFTSKYLDRYNKFDSRIERALNDLRDKGERPNYSFIKAIMMIESGMIPRKNRLGFHGFPQTKWKYMKPINKKFGTNFNMEDLYDPERSAQFIHYYLKALEPLSYVNNVEDFAASYNWGVGNYKKYLQGKKEMPKETEDYVALAKTMMNKIKSQDSGNENS